jgi:stage IV sporulation protein FB
VSAKPHFSIAGIPVRVEPVFLVIAGLWGLRWLDYGFDIVLVWIACAFISILVHELGHGFALKAFGQRSAIVLHGFGGVTISPRRAALSRARSIIVSVAGSVTALLVLWLPCRTLLGSDWGYEQLIDYATNGRLNFWFPLYFLAFQNLWWSLVNLLPIRPLDGGNVTAELFGIHLARRISVGVAIGGAVFAFLNDQGYGGFFALFLALSNYQEIRAERAGANVDVFQVESPDPGVGTGPDRTRRRGRANLSVVGPAPSASTMGTQDPERVAQLAWAALREGDAALAKQLTSGLGSNADPYLRAATALATGEPDAFELYEAAYVREPNGPPNLIATEVLARSGAATAVARRLVERSDGKGRDGAGTLQTHLHYANRFAEAAEVGEVVYAANPPSRAQTAFEVACSWAKAGSIDHAASWLEKAADAGFRAPSVVDGEPDLATVRADPRWPLLRARLT